jgi:hypothetical protein
VVLLRRAPDQDEYLDLHMRQFADDGSGVSLQDQWKNVELITYTSGNHSLYSGDKHRDAFIRGESFDYFSEAAISALGSLLTDNGELLPVTTRFGPYFHLNVMTRVTGLLDLSKVELRPGRRAVPPTLDITGPLYFVECHSALPPIFRLTEEPFRGVYVSEEFKTAVERAKLKGFAFYNRQPGVGFS